MGLPKEFIDLANEKLTAINKAYNEIKNDKRNINYKEQLSQIFLKEKIK